MIDLTFTLKLRMNALFKPHYSSYLLETICTFSPALVEFEDHFNIQIPSFYAKGPQNTYCSSIALVYLLYIYYFYFQVSMFVALIYNKYGRIEIKEYFIETLSGIIYPLTVSHLLSPPHNFRYFKAFSRTLQ